MQHLDHDFLKRKLLAYLLPYSLPSHAHRTGWPALTVTALQIRATPACLKDSLFVMRTPTAYTFRFICFM